MTFRNLIIFVSTLVVGATGMWFLHGETILSGLNFLPGDLVDSRFNALVLEHNYQTVISGEFHKYWDPTWNMFPQKNTLAFSDNLLGSSFIYILWRSMTEDPLRAFQLWLITCSALNYGAMYILMRTLKIGNPGAIAGAFLFAFSMPRGM